jgi:hypothetical protein
MSKSPPSAEAAASLKSVLATSWTAESRYTDMIAPAMQYLSIELARREITRRRRQPPWSRVRTTSRSRSQVHNYLGSQFMAAGQAIPDYGPQFFERAGEEFESALDHDRDWYQPHENLADIYSLRSQAQTGAAATSLLWQAIDEYDCALHFIGISTHDRAVALAGRRVRIGRARALLLLSRYDRKQLPGAWKEMSDLRKGWAVESEQSGRILYNLASWYGVANSLYQTALNRSLARRYLACALARERALIAWAGHDPDFESVIDGYDRFSSLLKLRLLTGVLPGPQSEFVSKMKALLAEAQWH